MSKQPCYHCGADCDKNPIEFDAKEFCCNGCKTVYEILNASELSCYYDLESSPGTIPKDIKGKYNYLDNADIVEKLVEFDDGTTTVVELQIPVIHCSSCIWVLENLDKLDDGVVTSIVDFPKKRVRVTYKNEKTSLKKIVELTTSIGYEPYISLEDSDTGKNKENRTLLYQMVVAAFCFGNIMMLSFPEYFEVDEFWLHKYKYLFRWMIFVMALPVVFYSAQGYYTSAYKGLKHKMLNIDVPITLGILVLFVRSSVEIMFDIGTGFFDSLSGLVFFLLVGKFFQQKTYDYLSFERDYKSYFPIAVTKVSNQKETNIAVQDIQKGDRLLIRNEELIPVDGILINGNAAIDYSFVTGESLPVVKKSGDKLFAGGKQTAGAIEVEVASSITQSYLTQLWGNDVFTKPDQKNIKSLTDKMSRYFTFTILLIALFAGIFWYFYNSSMVVNVVTAVLIIACPCALALSAPFATGNVLRILGYKKFYLKNASVIEKMSKIDTLIFDKTGTITSNDETHLEYRGTPLNSEELKKVKSVLRASNHPLSRALYKHLKIEDKLEKPDEFQEILGSGIQATVQKTKIQLGSANFVKEKQSKVNETTLYIKIDDEIKGCYVFKNSYRKGTKEILTELSKNYSIDILSGDNDGEKEFLKQMLPPKTKFQFNQKPNDKLEYVKKLQQQGKQVMMVGDGLNDAGALAQSNVGVAISESVNVFSPACDAILDAKVFEKLPVFFKITKRAISIIKMSFAFSFFYNIIGLYFALTGQLTPVVAAILMPVSSISIVIFVTIATNITMRRL